MLSIEERLKRDELFKVGDKVMIRSVDDMIKEYGRDDVYPKHPSVLFSFPVGMNDYCGKTFKIVMKSKDIDEGYCYKLDNILYDFSSDMFELPEKKKKSNN